MIAFVTSHCGSLFRIRRVWSSVALALICAACPDADKSDGPTPPTTAPLPSGAVVASVSVTPTTASLTVGTTASLTATIRDAAGNLVSGKLTTWSTSDAVVASVSASGTVTAIKPGSTIVTATCDGKSASATVTVLPVPVASVSITVPSPSMIVGSTQGLTVTVRDAAGTVLTGREVSWTSSASAVAAVGASGVVTAITPGTTTISATSEGKTGTTTIAVIAPPALGRIASIDSVLVPFNPPLGVEIATTNAGIYLWWTQSDGNTRVVRRQGGIATGTWQSTVISGKASITPVSLYTERPDVFSFYWARRDSIGLYSVNTGTPSAITWPQFDVTWRAGDDIQYLVPNSGSAGLPWALGLGGSVYRQSRAHSGVARIPWDTVVKASWPTLPALSDSTGRLYYNRGASNVLSTRWIPTGRIEVVGTASGVLNSFDLSAYGMGFTFQRYDGDIWAFGQRGFFKMNGAGTPKVVWTGVSGLYSSVACISGGRIYMVNESSVSLSGSDAKMWLADGTLSSEQASRLYSVQVAMGVFGIHCYQQATSGSPFTMPNVLLAVGTGKPLAPGIWLYQITPLP